MISGHFCDFVNASAACAQETTGFFQTNLLNIFGICQAGLILDQPVKIIFLEMKLLRQIGKRNVGIMCGNIIRYFFENNPVNGFSLLLGQRKFVFRTENTEDTEQKPFADIVGTNLIFIQFF